MDPVVGFGQVVVIAVVAVGLFTLVARAAEGTHEGEAPTVIFIVAFLGLLFWAWRSGWLPSLR